MILENTPYSQVIQTMLDEKEKVSFAMRKLRKMKNMPEVFVSTYTLPSSKNTYLFWGGKIKVPTFFTRPTSCNYRMGSCLMVNTNNGERMVYCLSKKADGNKTYDCLLVYTSHFFKRYRERAMVSETMPTLELISLFMNRNIEMIPLDYEEFTKKPMKNGTAMQMCDGVLLGTETKYNEDGYEYYVVKNNTFLTESILKTDQEEELVTGKKMQKRLADCAKEFVKSHPLLSKFV